MGMYYYPKGLKDPMECGNIDEMPEWIVAVCDDKIVRISLNNETKATIMANDGNFDDREFVTEQKRNRTFARGFFFYYEFVAYGLAKDSEVLSIQGYKDMPRIEVINDDVPLPKESLTKEEISKYSEKKKLYTKAKAPYAKEDLKFNYVLCGGDNSFSVKRITRRDKELVAMYTLDALATVLNRHSEGGEGYLRAYCNMPTIVSFNCKCELSEPQSNTTYENAKYAILTLPDKVLAVRVTEAMKKLFKTRYKLNSDEYVGRKSLLNDLLTALGITADTDECECDVVDFEPVVIDYK